MDAADSAAIARLALRNFRSFRRADVSLGRLTVLVGPNGSGKSNLLDALRFLAECMRPPLADILRERGGIGALRYRGEDGPIGMAVSLRLSGQMNSPKGWFADYSFELEVLRSGDFRVAREACAVRSTEDVGVTVSFERKGREVSVQGERLERTAPDPRALLLPSIGGTLPWSMVFEALRGIAVYDPVPHRMRELRDREADALDSWLLPDAANIASLLERMEREQPDHYARVHDFLHTAVAQIDHIFGRSYGPKIGLVGRQILSEGRVEEFEARDLSDGTLHLLGMLVALYQPSAPLVVGLEEPETSLHPRAMGVVWDALNEACGRTQVIATTHSPDVLDRKEVSPRSLRLVAWEAGESVVRRLDRPTERALARHVFTAGELLRAGALRVRRRESEAHANAAP
jgi:predicted ATPase